MCMYMKFDVEYVRIWSQYTAIYVLYVYACIVCIVRICMYMYYVRIFMYIYTH